MSNSTQNETYELEYHPGTDISVVCPYCGIGSFAHRHKVGSNPKDFERLPEASKTKDRALQKDWREKIRIILLAVVKYYSPDILKGDYGRMDIPRIPPSDALDLIEELLADTRKEVIRKIEIWTKDSLQNGNVEEFDCLKELQDVLATLREEEKVVEKNV